MRCVLCSFYDQHVQDVTDMLTLNESQVSVCTVRCVLLVVSHPLCLCSPSQVKAMYRIFQNMDGDNDGLVTDNQMLSPIVSSTVGRQCCD